MTDSPNLGLPYIEAAQAQKHVTHNEALRVLDRLVHLAVLDRDLAAPPGSPAEGQRWIVAASPTGAWAGHATHVAAWQDGAWEFSAPNGGWLAYVIDEGALLTWNGSAWVDALSALSAWQNLTLLGIGTTADATNPFSAKLNNALWTARTAAEGGNGDLRYKMSKEAAANTLSLLFQDNFSGRAEMGLTGDDDFHFKVSPDGASWLDAIVIDKDTGVVTLPNTSGGGGGGGDMLKSTYDADADGKIDAAAGGTGVGSAAANLVFSGPSSGAAAAPGFRALVGNDLPNPSSTTKGGVKSAAAVSHKFVTAIGTDGSITQAQPVAGDVSGLAASATTDTTNATNISSGTLSGARLPTPSSSVLGGVKSLASAASKWINAIGTDGVPTATQPSAGDVSGLAASATTDTTNATNISSGTLSGARLPTPSSSVLGGIKSLASAAHNWINAIGTDGVPTASQPAFTDISGAVAAAQMPALTGDVTTSAGAVATTIAAGVVTFAKLASAAIASAAQYLANTASLLLTTDKVWSAAATVALTDGATITPDFSTGINFTVTLGGNRTLANPTNQKVGQSGFIRIAQDGTGSRTLAYGSNWKFAGGSAPTLTTTASKVDVLAYVVTGSSEIMASLTKAIV